VSLALARVDDRLVHGQVVIGWGTALRAKRLLVVDDVVAARAWERDLLAASAGDLQVRVVPVAEAAAALAEEARRPGAAIVLFRSPQAARAAVEAGAELTELNLGGLHHAAGKERVLDYVYLDATDREALAALAARGVRLVAQDLPSSAPVDARAWLRAAPGA
jgi:mannose/fructose/N-acetylgalactosamine-specific phosphotransferase system component IIB